MSTRNSPDFAILDNWIFNNFILADDELFLKALKSLETCLSVNNNLYGKLVSPQSPVSIDERFKVTSVWFYIPDFSLPSCELDNFKFKWLFWHILY